MKAKVKSLGSVTDLSEYIYDEDGNQYTWDELELIDDDKWQHYRIQAAIAAMQGLISGGIYTSSTIRLAQERGQSGTEFIAQMATEFADDLIAELQKKGGQDEQTRRI